MTGAEVVALVSVVTSGVVGPLLVNYGSAWRLRRETERERGNELRDHLDQAGLRLTEARATVLDLTGTLLDSTQPQLLVQTRMPALTTELEQLRKNTDRIAVRTGSGSRLTSTYAEAMAGVKHAIDVFTEVHGGAPFDKGRLERVQAEIKISLAAQDRFFDAASQAVGLPERNPGKALVHR